MGGSVDFYDVSAQVIPVLVLALLLEQRTERKAIGPLGDLVLVLSSVLAASLGEFVALHNVYRSAGAPTDQYFVIGSIGYLALALVVPVIAGPLREIEARGGKITKAVAWVAVAFAAWAILVFGLAARY